MDKNRHTGRTTRMLEQAIAKAHETGYVFVVADNENHAKQLRQLCSEITGRPISGPKIYLTDSAGPGAPQISIDPVEEAWDWETMSVRGAYPNIPVFVDHHAIETRFGHILDEYHRYDAEPAAVTPD